MSVRASMRPRHYAGESGVPGRPVGVPQKGFNEAPALRRGKWLSWRRSPRRCRRFNEAPALRRGKLSLQSGDDDMPAIASMRPRHYAGESLHAPDGAVRPGLASMRPRHYAGESAAQAALPAIIAGALQ